MRIISIVFVTIISFFILRLNVLLYTENFTKEEQRDDIVLQLNFLEDELKNNTLGERMQDIFPEGYVFVNALYGLTWCELALSETITPKLKKRALNEALYAFENINGNEGRLNFPPDLLPEYGIFYNGWKNYLLSKIMLVDTNFNLSKIYIEAYKTNCEEIAWALKRSTTPFLASYPYQSWPADMLVAMASLNNYDKIFAPKYKHTIENWLQTVKQKVDPKTGLIAHKVDSETGLSTESSRGSSISLMIRMLFEIDTVFAQEQYKLMKQHFDTEAFGLPSIDEFSKGEVGEEDIDSGPVILGVGFAGTIVKIGALSRTGEDELAEQQYKTIHAFGFCTKSNNQKKYLFGKLPMADAFIAWGRATALHQLNDKTKTTNWFWAFKFHLISLGLISFLWLLVFRKRVIQISKSKFRKPNVPLRF